MRLNKDIQSFFDIQVMVYGEAALAEADTSFDAQESTVKPDISEFTYGFALTHELMTSLGLQPAGAPIFPSQVQEGKLGGFDVQLPGLPVFLQFKLSDYLRTRRALHYNTFGGSYYRFKIRALSSSQQHNLLLDLEADGNRVAYVAPRFHTLGELNFAFSNREIVRRSAFAVPSNIGPLPDHREHSVSFSVTGNLAVFRSEPRHIELVDPHDLFVRDDLRHTEARPERPGTLRELGHRLLAIYERHHGGQEAESARSLRRSSERFIPADYARFVALSFFDSELMFIPHNTSADYPRSDV